MLERISGVRRFSRFWLLAGSALIACLAALVAHRAAVTGPITPHAAAPEVSAPPPQSRPGSDHRILVACSIAADHADASDRPEAVRSLPAIRANTTFWLNTPEQKAALEAILAFLPHMTYTDVFRPGYFCPADFNRDNLIDATDEALFLQAWTDAAHPLAGWADLNDDGVLDASDLDEFVRRTQAGDCDPAATERNRLMVC